jgi:hypothetical protein
MYARVTQLEIDSLRIDVADALQIYKRDVVPALEEQPGYCGALVLVTPEGKGQVTTLWQTEEQADASATPGFYASVLERFVTFFRAPPGRERYEVVFADIPAFVEG